jgi:hypothetical protein
MDRQELRNAYRRVFTTPDGEVTLASLARFCGAGSVSFVPGDPQHTAYNEGKRSVLLHIESMINPIRSRGRSEEDGNG